MKNGFFLTLTLATLFLLTKSSWEQHEPELPAAELVETILTVDANLTGCGIRALPGNNYLSGAIDEDCIRLLAHANVRVIIRLNGDSQADRGPLSISEEAALCEAYGIRFYYLNIEGDIPAAGTQVTALMKQGNALVHCRHGAHRAPAMAGYYLKQAGFAEEEIITLIGWKELVHHPGRYARYVEALLETAPFSANTPPTNDVTQN